MLLSPAARRSRNVRRELVNAGEAGKPLLPLLVGLTYRDYDALLKNDDEFGYWLAGAAPIEVPEAGVADVIERVVAGIPPPQPRKGAPRKQAAASALCRLTTAQSAAAAFAAAGELKDLRLRGSREELRGVVATDGCESRVAACAWLLGELGDKKAGRAIRTAIESRRRAPGPLSCLLRSLHQIEGRAGSAYLADALLAARDYQQEGVLSMLWHHADEFRGEPEIAAAVRKLASAPTSPSVARPAKQVLRALRQ
jgi:hypothetical protein